MRKKGFPTPIQSLLSSYLKERGWTEKLQEYRIWTQWQDVIGAKLSQKSRPLKLKNKVLTIGVENSAWLTQLQFMKLNIIEKVQKDLNICLRDIYFKISP